MIQLSHPGYPAQCGRSFLVEQLGSSLVVTPVEELRQIPAVRFSSDLGELVSCLTPENRLVIVDLGRAFDGGSSDRLLGMLSMLWKRARQCDAAVALCNLTPQARQLMNRTRLDRVWPIYGSRTAALGDQP